MAEESASHNTEFYLIILKMPCNSLCPDTARNIGYILGRKKKCDNDMCKRISQGNFPGAPVVESSRSNAGGTGSSPGWGLRSLVAK